MLLFQYARPSGTPNHGKWEATVLASCQVTSHELFLIGKNMLSLCHATTNQFVAGDKYLTCGDFHERHGEDSDGCDLSLGQFGGYLYGLPHLGDLLLHI